VRVGEARRLFISPSSLILFSCSALVFPVKELRSFPDRVEAVRIISGLHWIGLFSDELLVPRAGNLLDTLCARLETLMTYAPGERDLVMLQHKFVIERADGAEVRICKLKNGLLRVTCDWDKN
jgi:spermidine synthase